MISYLRKALTIIVIAGAWTSVFPQTAQEEVQKRIDIINQLIKERGYKWKASITSLSYLSKEEGKALCGEYYNQNEFERDLAWQDSMYKEYKSRKGKGLLKTLSPPDWKSMMSLIEYQECGNCWAHATTGVVEGLLHYQHGSNVGIDLYEMDITNNNACDGGCNGGTASCGFSYVRDSSVVHEPGLNAFPNYDHAHSTILSYDEDAPTSISNTQSALNSSPVYASMWVYEDFFYDYTSGIYEYTWGDYLGSHGVIIVGYNDEDEYWVCKNSWGTGWGESGYFKIAYGECGIDSRRCVTASVNASCLAKLITGLMSLSDAMGYSFANEEWAYIHNNTTLSSNVTVPSSKTLRILSNLTVNLNGYYIKSTSGTLTRESGVTFTPKDISVKSGTTLKGQYSKIQSAINNASSGQYVYPAAGTYNENIYIGSNIVVYGAGRNNTTINGTADVDGYFSRLHGFTVTGSIHSFGGGGQIIEWVKAQGGIELDYGAEKYITSVIVTGNSTSAIDAFQTDTYIDGLMAITVGNTYGVYARQYADVVLDGYQIENKERGVYLYNRADAYIKDLEFCLNGYDIYAGYASYAEAVGNWLVFSGDPAVKTYGDVDYPEEWDECHGFKKAIVASTPDAPDPAAQAANANDPGVSDYRTALAGLHAIKQKLMADLKVDIRPDPRNYKSDYEASIDHFKQVVARYPGTPSSLKAIARVSACNFSLDQPEEVYDYVNSVAKSPEFSAVKHEVLSFLIPYHVNKKDYDQALQLSDELLENSTDDDFACGILYGEGIIHRYCRHDLAGAAEVFRMIIANYPDNPNALAAQDQLARMGEYVPGDAPTEPETVEALALEGYPNPFNPTATIRFGLPEEGQVILKIYDVLGREVATLVDGYMDAGQRQIVWSGKTTGGREVPSGIYIARLTTPATTRSIKLVLLK